MKKMLVLAVILVLLATPVMIEAGIYPNNPDCRASIGITYNRLDLDIITRNHSMEAGVLLDIRLPISNDVTFTWGTGIYHGDANYDKSNGIGFIFGIRVYFGE